MLDYLVFINEFFCLTWQLYFLQLPVACWSMHVPSWYHGVGHITWGDHVSHFHSVSQQIHLAQLSLTHSAFCQSQGVPVSGMWVNIHDILPDHALYHHLCHLLLQVTICHVLHQCEFQLSYPAQCTPSLLSTDTLPAQSALAMSSGSTMSTLSHTLVGGSTPSHSPPTPPLPLQPLHLHRWNSVQFTRVPPQKSLHFVRLWCEIPWPPQGYCCYHLTKQGQVCWSLVKQWTWNWFFNKMESAHFSAFQKLEYSSFVHSHLSHSYIGSCLQQYLSVHSRRALLWQRRPPLGHINHCESSWSRNGLCLLLISISITLLVMC